MNLPSSADANIVDKNANVQPVQSLLDGRIDVLALGEISRNDDKVRLGVFAQLVSDALELLGVSRDEDDLHTAAGEFPGVLFPEAVGGACDYCPLAVLLHEIHLQMIKKHEIIKIRIYNQTKNRRWTDQISYRWIVSKRTGYKGAHTKFLKAT